MSTWRRKALESFPDLRPEIQHREANVYTVFFALLTRCKNAHRAGDAAELRKIYDFAEWCMRSRKKNLWNPAGVCFYENLPDSPETLRDLPQWVSPDIFWRVSGLLEWRMGEAAFHELQTRYFAHWPDAPRDFPRRVKT